MSSSPDNHDDSITFFTGFRMFYSMSLVIFSIIIVMTLIFNRDTKISHDIHPALAFVLIWGAIIWLSMVEGGQGAIVALPPVDRALYKESHLITAMICERAHKGDNLNRYLIGRQFLVVLIVFVINMSGGPLKGSEVLGLPQIVIEIFLNSGVAMILLTTIVGQLTSQVNAANCMLDYINTHFMTMTLYVAQAIEASGLLHSVYLIQNLCSVFTGKPIETFEEPRSTIANIFFWGRVVMSVAILGFAFAVTLTGFFQGKTTAWPGIPSSVSVILFFVLMCIVGTLEGMQIAFFAVAKLPVAERGTSKLALATCDLLFCGGGRNLPGFMIGRQICVTMNFFVVARLTSLNIDVDAGDETIFGVSPAMQKFFNTGLLGAIFTTTLASLIWQLVAGAFPIAFLSNPLCYVLLRLGIFLEATGICAGSWFLALVHKKIAGFQRDEVYIGTCI
jgi:silicon transporter